MAIYYKFKSARDYDTISMDGPFITVGLLKEKIYETKHLGSGKDLDIVISNAQTNEEYLDEAMLIPKNTSVLIRRVPGRPRIRIITREEPRVEDKVENVQADMNNVITADASPVEDEFDEFGNDLYSIPDAPAVHSNNLCHDSAPADDEETKLKALIDTPALDWHQQGADSFGPGRGYGRGMAGRMGGRGFGMERTTPPPGYVCHRCNVSGHFIQHCSTNGNPNFDVKRVKPPTGIPKSMLMATPNGSYSLPSGAVAVLKPNEDAFEKEMEGLTSTTRSVGEFPPELKCPLCKEVMRDAALASKCCLKSYCDKCIRDHIIAKSMCVCGATHVLADDLLPNKTLRDTINRILESGNSSAENAGSMCQVQDMESVRCPPPKALSPTTSAASGGEKKPAPSNNNETSTLKPSIEIAEITSAWASAEIVKVEKPVDASANIQGSSNGKEAAVSQLNTQPPKEEMPQQVASGEQAGKRKKKKPRMSGTDLAGPDYMMPMGPGPGNQYFNGFQPGFNGVQHGFNGVQPGFNGFHHGFNGFPGPFPGAMPPFVGYGFGGVIHPDPFAAQGFGFPNIPPPYRDLAEMGNRMNLQHPIMGREEFEAKKTEMKRKRENEIRRSEGGNVVRDSEKSRIMNNSAVTSSPVKPKSRQGPPPPISSDYDRRRRSDRSSPERQSSRRFTSPPRSSSRKSERDRHHDLDSEHDRRRDRPRETDRKHRKRSEKSSSDPTVEIDDNNKSNVFTRISFPEESSGKQRKTSKSSPAPPESSVAPVSSGRRHHSRREREMVEYDSSDDEDRHFKRKPSRYKRSPSVAPSDAGDEHFRHSKRSKGERARA
ncbi:DWNN domain, a CCHC-type zinc finger [Arabidopsis thaliana]|uniref:Isoform 2 of E3 ubiquitin ligase PARAQUAT TOLERANCE 3 n=1 Tax=Arabidopsis thaliana TaxID=3702 RepID=F4JP52-2|nr:DWNN domain, a CCHC-type zinc finger [Arabidopsis thaliana]NP_001190751.1 DWNN domain, a CCHC-type zinc finger [Arabidopsis thaliana]AEE83885.1 DWNN domain, a CCHC-type zinc finger [Arabidopsis thaliana]AEE83886.1 DWNN domain, a CCHC-type zinc finger [Arabidopsis thaliana]|eukprot:NP_001190750.1 DWNN domain, a CCHC-type zinc finger [Arabidopsis thaliana]